jgi:hypothetical protein
MELLYLYMILTTDKKFPIYCDFCKVGIVLLYIIYLDVFGASKGCQVWQINTVILKIFVSSFKDRTLAVEQELCYFICTVLFPVFYGVIDREGGGGVVRSG